MQLADNVYGQLPEHSFLRAMEREELDELLRFATTKGDGEQKTVSLDQYLERKADDQEAIYYICAETYETAARSPHLEVFKERDVEVLLTVDHTDAMKEVAWARESGSCRTVCLALGHDNKAWSNPAFQTVLQNSIRWAAGK